MTDSPQPDQKLTSVFTTSLANIFAQLKISLAVTAYQAGKVILVRYEGDDGHSNGVNPPSGRINTHFRNFYKPMGLARRGNRLSVGG